MCGVGRAAFALIEVRSALARGGLRLKDKPRGEVILEYPKQ
jgi:hypothetical protein